MGKMGDYIREARRGELMDPDTGDFYFQNPKFTRLKPLVWKFFRVMQGLYEWR